MNIGLQGSAQLKRRLDNLKTSFKPAGRKWADDTVAIARTRVPVRTGKTQRSIRVRNNTQTRSAVVAIWGARFIEVGTKEHDIKAKRSKALAFKSGGRTIFTRKVHKQRIAPRPFLSDSAALSLDRNPHAAEIVRAWNEGG